jgi:hypothetical protein
MGVQRGIKSENGNEKQVGKALEGSLCEDTIPIGFWFVLREKK